MKYCVAIDVPIISKLGVASVLDHNMYPFIVQILGTTLLLRQT